MPGSGIAIQPRTLSLPYFDRRSDFRVLGSLTGGDRGATRLEAKGGKPLTGGERGEIIGWG